MSNVHVEIEADELARIMEMSLSEVTLLDLVMAMKHCYDKTEQEAAKAAEDDPMLMAIAELTDKVELLSRRVEELSHSTHEINRHLIIMSRRGGGGDYSDTLLFP